MTYRQFGALKQKALECATLNDYIATCGDSAPEGVLADIWTMAYDPTFVTLQKMSDMGNKQFSETYGIKLRTIEDWRSHARTISQTFFDLLCVDVITEKNKI